MKRYFDPKGRMAIVTGYIDNCGKQDVRRRFFSYKTQKMTIAL